MRNSSTQQRRRLVITRPKLTQYQREMIYSDSPNTICEATTKAGKTFSHAWWLFEEAHKPPLVADAKGVLRPKVGSNYWWVAPTYGQAKIAFARIRRTIPKGAGYIVNLSEHTITTPVGSVLWFKSGDNPDNLYGDDVEAAVIDEASRIKEEAFVAVRSTLTKTKGRLKIIGNVKGTMNWAYKLARRVESNSIPGWSYYKITCADAVAAGILEQEDIDAAEAVLPHGIFLELYYGIPFVNATNKFAFAFDKSKHVKPCAIDARFPIYLSFDFNRNPICCTVAQLVGNKIKIPFTIKLANSNIYELCKYIKNKFAIPGQPEPTFFVNGDASGNAGSAMVPDNLNYFRIIKSELGLPVQQMKQLAANPRIEENQVLVNACLEHVEHEIDPTGAAALIFDLEFAEMLPDGTLKKRDREDETQQLDALDTYRYLINTNFRHLLKGYR